MHKSKNLKIINIGHLISQAISRTPGVETPNALQQQHAFKRPKGQQKLTEKIKWQTNEKNQNVGLQRKHQSNISQKSFGNMKTLFCPHQIS